jgi:hypothetical protein
MLSWLAAALAIILSAIFSACRLAFGVAFGVGVAGRLLFFSASSAGKSSSCKVPPIGCLGCDCDVISRDRPLSVARDLMFFLASATGVTGFGFLGD